MKWIQFSWILKYSGPHLFYPNHSNIFVDKLDCLDLIWSDFLSFGISEQSKLVENQLIFLLKENHLNWEFCITMVKRYDDSVSSIPCTTTLCIFIIRMEFCKELISIQWRTSFRCVKSYHRLNQFNLKISLNV